MRDLQELFERAKDYLDVIGVPYSKDIEWIRANSRYTTRYGNCRRYYNHNKDKYMYQLQVAKFLLSDEIMDEKVVLSTIMHEIIHTCDGCMPHNEKFHYWGDLVTDCYGIEITTYVSEERAKKVQDAGVAPKRRKLSVSWEFMCDNYGCEIYGHVWRYKRMPKWMNNGFNSNSMTVRGVGCPLCGANLTITRWTDKLNELPMYFD